MSCLQIHGRSDSAFQCIFPSCHAHAPFVARLQTREVELRMSCHKIVAIEHREIQEIARHLDANGVQTDVPRSSPAISVAIKSGHRIGATGFQLGSQNVGRHADRLANIGLEASSAANQDSIV